MYSVVATTHDGIYARKQRLPLCVLWGCNHKDTPTAGKKTTEDLFLQTFMYTVKKDYRFSRLIPARESLVRDIPAGDGKIAYPFLTVYNTHSRWVGRFSLKCSQLTPLRELTSDISLFSPTELNFILHIMYVDSTLNFILCFLLRRLI